ncbi:hypothetical protein SGCOL_001772 [Colletotrichum sp. CLE4]
MYCKNIAIALAVATGVIAQRPTDTPICDYYTTALLKNNTGANQYTLLTLLVNTVVIGNYTMPNVGIKVDGILAPGMYNDTEVNLLPYFNGDLASSNRGGSSGVSVNFLDGGGAAPLMKNMPANDDTSKQYQPATAIPEQGPQLQAICIEDSCPISANSTRASYQPAMAPKNATATGGMNATMTATMTGATMTSTMTPSTVPTAGAAVQGVSLALIAGLLACLV